MGLRELLSTLWPSDTRHRDPSATGDDRVPFAGGRRRAGDLQTTAQRFLVLVGLSLLLVLLWLLRELLVLVFLASLVAAAMYGPSAWLERRIPRLAAIGLTYLAVVAVLGLLLLFIVPPLVEQATELVDELPALVEEAEAQIVDIGDAIAGEGAGQRAFDAIVPDVEDVAGDDQGQLLNVPFTVLSILVNTLVVFFLSALLLLERDAIRRWSMRFFVARDRRPLVNLSRDALGKLGAYVRGQLVVMVITGVGTATGMMLFGVPFALPMAVFGFLAEAIPLAGPIILGVPVLTLAWLESPATAGFMLIWLVALQQLEGWVIYPMVQGRILSLSPAVVVLAVLAGAQLYGVLGAVIALPLVAVGDVVIRDVIFPLRRQASREDTAAATHPSPGA